MQNAIGECEWCGVVDHHLAAGLCAGCAARAVTLDAPRTIYKCEECNTVYTTHEESTLCDCLYRHSSDQGG